MKTWLKGGLLGLVVFLLLIVFSIFSSIKQMYLIFLLAIISIIGIFIIWISGKIERYYLKAGLIGGIVGFFLPILDFFRWKGLPVFPPYIGYYYKQFIGNLGICSTYFCFILLRFLFSTIIFFIIGAIIGLIIEKIKSK